MAQTLMVPSPAFSLPPASMTSCGIRQHKLPGEKRFDSNLSAPNFGSIAKWTATVKLTGVILKGSGKEFPFSTGRTWSSVPVLTLSQEWEMTRSIGLCRFLSNSKSTV